MRTAEAENQPRLIADLEGDPFVGHVLSSCMFLAPADGSVDHD